MRAHNNNDHNNNVKSSKANTLWRFNRLNISVFVYAHGNTFRKRFIAVDVCQGPGLDMCVNDD